MSITKDRDDIRFLGFKEIRYPYINDLQEYLEFLMRVFQNAYFIFNFRDHENVLNSGFFKELNQEKKTFQKESFRFFEQECLDFHHKHPATSTILKYEEYFHDPSELVRVLDEIGLGITLKDIKELLSVPHSYDQTNFKLDK